MILVDQPLGGSRCDPQERCEQCGFIHPATEITLLDRNSVSHIPVAFWCDFGNGLKELGLETTRQPWRV